MSLSPAKQIEAFVAYQNEVFLGIFGGIFGVFAAVGLLGRFDKTINKNLIGYFSAKPSASDEECEGQPLKPIFRYRKTIVQVLDWVSYAVISAFIVTDGLYADSEQGADCNFAENNYASPNGPYTCFSVRLELDGTSFTTALDCLLAPPVVEGYYCFRKVDPSEANFYSTTEVIGISAALLPPFMFGVKLLAFVIVSAVKMMTFCIEGEKMKRMVRKGAVVVQWLVIFPCIMYLCLFLFHDYVIGYEIFTTIIFVYVSGTVHALMTFVDSEVETEEASEDKGVTV